MYDRHVGAVFGLVYHLVARNRTIAEDVNQEVWLIAIEQANKFDPARGEFRDWLLGIARNRALRRRRTAPDSTNRLELASDESPEGLVPLDLMESVERADMVRAALLCLQDDWRQTLLHKYTDGLSVAEIASRTGRSVKAVESVLSRARGRLRSLLRPYFSNTVEGIPHASHDT
jgi:RNA polymerase sigma-70 factor (ECF subfamily)